ncbi:hypothetical protein [Rhodococcus qingshengii]|uniref:hypothetical protein n=1 Tax=Rhodococcus qingshengii TaxID=334542 RepID=UPI002AFFBCF4|nr:hypothetical protein [Rhodococcus qingshengii]MEA1798680.1 hypothetical protein [Rhodococcus qingshengii]
MTAEITCAVDPQHRAVVRSALQLLAASGYVKTRRESRPNGIGGYDQWHRIAEPFTVELEVENAGTYIWKAWDVET